MSAITPLGIDISKKTFDVYLLNKPKGGRSHQFANTPEGFVQLEKWLERQKAKNLHACLEATNIYGHGLATFLVEQGYIVSIVNPARIKGYAQSQLSRTKNDRADAALIARFCRDLQPSPWQPTPEILVELQRMVRRWQALEQMTTQEKNRLLLYENDPELRGDIEAHLAFLQQQKESLKKRMDKQVQKDENLATQKALLTSIPGIGEQTATFLLAELGDVTRFTSARQLAAFAGLTPQERLSGTSLLGKTRLCKIGNCHLRKLMYFPALTAIRYCEPLQAFRQRLLDAGKTKMQAVGAIMHKLLRVVYGVLKSRRPFDPTLLTPQISFSESLAF